MIAQVVLSILLAFVLVYAWAQFPRSPPVAAGSMLAGLAGLYLVWAPSQSTVIAEFIGIGRGADLILYLWVCISMNMFLSLYLKLRTQDELLTKLARAMALNNVVSSDDGITADPGQTAPEFAADEHMSRRIRGQTV